MRVLNIALIASFLGIISGHASADTIVYRGSSTVGQFMYAAAKVYNAAAFDINTRSESSGGEDAIAAGKADLGGVARDVKQKILATGVKKYLFGKDAIGILVHLDNPLHQLTMHQLAGIFSGRITNWNEVGGNDMPIDVYIVNPRSATRSVFQKKVLGDITYGGKRIRTIRPDARIIDMVANNPGGIGQLSFSFLKEANIKLIHPDGQSPTTGNPDYPITRNLHLITGEKSSRATQAFIDWVLSPSGQAVVKSHFIGIE